MTLFSAVTSEIPDIPGPTTDRLLMVRLKEHVQFVGRVETEINTQREKYGEFVLRLRTVFGQPVVAVGFRGDVRLVPWSGVLQVTPHPDMRLDEGPVFYSKDWDDRPADAEPEGQQNSKPAKRRGRPRKDVSDGT